MNYLSLNKKNKSKKRYITLVLFIFVFGFFAYWPYVRVGMANSTAQVSSMVMFYVRIVGLLPDTMSNFFVDRAVLLSEIDTLKEELGKANEELGKTKALNYDLEKIALSKNDDYSAVRIFHYGISFPNFITKDFVIIGDTSGIELGDIVHTQGGIAFGIVKEVLDNTLLVSPFSACNEKTLSHLAKTDEVIEIIGQGNGTYKAEIPVTINILEGDELYLNSHKKYKIGEVVYLEKKEEDAFMTAYIKGVGNVLSIPYFYVKKAK